MKKEMRKILIETDIKKHMELKVNYFEHLANEGETEFLTYLQKYV